MSTNAELFPGSHPKSLLLGMPHKYLGAGEFLGALEGAARDKFDETEGLRPGLTIEHVLPDKWMQHWPLPDGSKAPLDGNVSVEDPRHSAIASRESANIHWAI